MKAKWLVLLVVLVSSTIVVDGQAEEGPVMTKDTERGYAYTFEDDPLDAAPEGAREARIMVRPVGKRTLLIRPRTHFIRELFKSAEDL